MDKRLIIVSGPSGVGKGPIIDWVKKLYIHDLCQVKIRKTKTERHTGKEEDIGFEGLSNNLYRFSCRGVNQALDLDELEKALEEKGNVLLETYYTTFDFLKDKYDKQVDFASVFISPLGYSDIGDLCSQNNSIEGYLPDLMLDSLVKRAQNDGKLVTRKLMDELKARAEDSINEMKFMHNYKYVIPNHCHESDSRWKFPSIAGKPLTVVRALADIIRTGFSEYADKGERFR